MPQSIRTYTLAFLVGASLLVACGNTENGADSGIVRGRHQITYRDSVRL